jgi:hypothetical protein
VESRSDLQLRCIVHSHFSCLSFCLFAVFKSRPMDSISSTSIPAEHHFPSFHLHLFPSMNYRTKLYLALAFAGYSDAFFSMSCPGRIVRERLDPVVSAGKISGHVHTISGGSGFAAAMTYEDARASKCTSCPIKVHISYPLHLHSSLTWLTGRSLQLLDSPTLRTQERRHISTCPCRRRRL